MSRYLSLGRTEAEFLVDLLDKHQCQMAAELAHDLRELFLMPADPSKPHDPSRAAYVNRYLWVRYDPSARIAIAEELGWEKLGVPTADWLDNAIDARIKAESTF